MRKKYVEGEEHSFEQLLEIVHVLRDPVEGCSWDSAQTHESMKECLTNEAQEVLQAIDNRDDQNLGEELGDVLLQVLLHAEIASERGAFEFPDIVQMLSDKLIRRHPHVFGEEPRPNSPEEALALWKRVKEAEKHRKEEK